ncbi:class I SAM-dependent methyltransferase [Methylobacterium nodulans]|uniref:Methyltransferase type 11 n=1 Tax=Methylobacterium nodulans (strain LMG 21967 / CNCM I-2342 / ORS 2060) TaxID=460265 RepID=B8II43_METNO|nr:class I SAM-dependent methyltransferase [Methylobacterium nodulans]ACL57912.1 Methyltransferase type 11 [Methylobacterium nodulans ORS 2060]
MTAPDKLFAGSIPQIYDQFLVPLIFAYYALDLAKRLSKLDPQDVLEIAAGTGALTRAMALQLSASAHVVATDLNQPMIDYAAQRLRDDRVTWGQADALALPFEEQSFDVVVCQFGVMFFPDKAQGYRETYRVLRPGGRFLFNIWDQISANEFAETVTESLSRLFPDSPPCFLARTPHGYHDVDRISEDLKTTHFKDISVDIVEGRSTALAPRDVAVAYCQGTPLRNEIEARDASRLEDATEQAAEALANRFGRGAIEGRIRAFVITAFR